MLTKADEGGSSKCWPLLTRGGGGLGNCWRLLTRGGGGVWKPPKLADIICGQPLGLRIAISPLLTYFVNTCLAIWLVDKTCGQMLFGSLSCLSTLWTTITREIQILQRFQLLFLCGLLWYHWLWFSTKIMFSPPRKPSPQIVVSFCSK